MTVSAKMVKELRDATGAGMMDCKKALVACDGDIAKASDFLRENGLLKAAKKQGRIATEGLVRLAFNEDSTAAAAVEVNSETDFVAKNEDFIAFVEKLAKTALENDAEGLEAFEALPYGNGSSVKEELTSKIATIGENMNIRRFAKCETPGVKYIGYVHGGGRIGVIVGLKTELGASEVESVGKDVAMQIASMRPMFVSSADVDPAYLEHEKEILTAQALNEGKPAAIVEKMITGRLKKELKAVCLLDQEFVKNSELSVKAYVESEAKKLGKSIAVVEMVRYEVGEGLQKREENFAEEVAKQAMK